PERILAAMLVAGLAACSGESGGPNRGGRQITLSIATRPTASAGASFALSRAPESFNLGNDTLVIDTVQLVIRKIRLNRIEAPGACAEDDQDDESAGAQLIAFSLEGEGHDGHDDDCEVVKAGPLVVDLPLGAGPARQFTVALDTGTYVSVHLQLHKLTGEGDADLLLAHPELGNASVRVVGTFNSTAFVFTSDLTVSEEVDLVPPLVVTDATPVQVTVMIDLSTWFVNAAGDGLVDPATALTGQPNENLVEHNIRSSLKAFEDENHDGEDDHHEGQDRSGHQDGDHQGGGPNE
ncbi:MAG: hypothetical protein ACREMO_03485, partial [Gemmatimonadales bacterium]